MRVESPGRVAYVVKRYPRFSETFIVNEILAHEAAGTHVEIFSLYPPNDTHFQNTLSQVRAPVTYLHAQGLRASDFWTAMEDAGRVVPSIWTSMDFARGFDARSVLQAAQLAAEIYRRGITHVHAHFATMSADVARIAAQWARIPFTVTAHAKDIFHETVEHERLRNVLSGATGVITVSDFNVEYLTKVVGLDARRVHRIYNGLDLDQLSFSNGARPPRIVSVGRLVPKKGMDDLISACAQLRDRGVFCECVLVGDGPEAPRLRSLVADMSLTDRVRLIGARPQRDVMEIVRSAALFAAPCVVADDGDRDGLPTVLVESMALGTPVIASDIVGIAEVVRHEDTGLLVRPRDPAHLAEALMRLLRSTDLQRSLAQRARHLVEREFSVHTNAAALRSFFTGAVQLPVARAS